MKKTICAVLCFVLGLCLGSSPAVADQTVVEAGYFLTTFSDTPQLQESPVEIQGKALSTKTWYLSTDSDWQSLSLMDITPLLGVAKAKAAHEAGALDKDTALAQIDVIQDWIATQAVVFVFSKDVTVQGFPARMLETTDEDDTPMLMLIVSDRTNIIMMTCLNTPGGLNMLEASGLNWADEKAGASQQEDTADAPDVAGTVQIDDFQAALPNAQSAGTTPVPADDGRQAEAAVWMVPGDVQFALARMDVTPWLDDVMRAEIDKTNTLGHVQLREVFYPFEQGNGLPKDSYELAMYVTVVQDIPALLYVLPNTDGTSETCTLVLCQGTELVICTWTSETGVDVRAALDFDWEAAKEAPLPLIPIGGMGWSMFLEEANLSNFGISDLSDLPRIARLHVLSLADNQIVDITPLAELVYLEELDLSGNQITDLSPLHGLKRLESINLNENPALTEKSVDALREALPDADIVWAGKAASTPQRIKPVDVQGEAEPVTLGALSVVFPGEINSQTNEDGMDPGDTTATRGYIPETGRGFYVEQFVWKVMQYPNPDLTVATSMMETLMEAFVSVPDQVKYDGKIHKVKSASGKSFYWLEYVFEQDKCRMLYDGETLYRLQAPNDAQGEAFIGSMTLE